MQILCLQPDGLQKYSEIEIQYRLMFSCSTHNSMRVNQYSLINEALSQKCQN